MSEPEIEPEAEPESVEWQCRNCHERHAPNFFACWKCGSDRTGILDPEFSVYDPANVNFFESLEERRGLKLQLPDFCYYLLPFFLLHASYGIYWMSIPALSIDSLLQGRGATPIFTAMTAQREIGLLAMALFVPLVLMPIFVQCWKLIPELFSRHDSATSLDRLETVSRSLVQMFVLPDTIGKSSPWFRVVYYGSFMVLFLTPLAKFLKVAVIGLR